jgi:hypothetical protein
MLAIELESTYDIKDFDTFVDRLGFQDTMNISNDAVDMSNESIGSMVKDVAKGLAKLIAAIFKTIWKIIGWIFGKRSAGVSLKRFKDNLAGVDADTKFNGLTRGRDFKGSPTEFIRELGVNIEKLNDASNQIGTLSSRFTRLDFTNPKLITVIKDNDFTSKSQLTKLELDFKQVVKSGIFIIDTETLEHTLQLKSRSELKLYGTGAVTLTYKGLEDASMEHTRGEMSLLGETLFKTNNALSGKEKPIRKQVSSIEKSLRSMQDNYKSVMDKIGDHQQNGDPDVVRDYGIFSRQAIIIIRNDINMLLKIIVLLARHKSVIDSYATMINKMAKSKKVTATDDGTTTKRNESEPDTKALPAPSKDK